MKPNGCWWFSPLRARSKQGMISCEIRMDFPKINAISSLITNRLLFFWETDQWTACHKRHLDKSWQQPSTQRIPIAVITDKTIENELIVSIIGNPPEYPPHSPSLSLYLTLMAWELKLFYNEGFPTAYSSHYAHMPTNTHTQIAKGFLLISCPAKWSHRNWGSRECVLFAGKTIQPSPVRARSRTQTSRRFTSWTHPRFWAILWQWPFLPHEPFRIKLKRATDSQQTRDLFTPTYPAKLSISSSTRVCIVLKQVFEKLIAAQALNYTCVLLSERRRRDF